MALAAACFLCSAERGAAIACRAVNPKTRTAKVTFLIILFKIVSLEKSGSASRLALPECMRLNVLLQNHLLVVDDVRTLQTVQVSSLTVDELTINSVDSE